MGAETVTTSDGRLLEVLECGDPQGRPVLVHHGNPQSRRVITHGDEAARAVGVRLMSYSRPGFGGSTFAEPSLVGSGKDALAVADALGVRQFATLGISGGAPFAAATAAVGGERVTRLGIAVGIARYYEVEPDTEDLDERKLMARADEGHLDETVEGYRAIGREVYDEMLAHEDDEDLMRAFDAGMGRSAPPEWMTPPMRARFAQDVRESLRSYDGFAYDNVAVWRWDVDVSRVRQTTFLWYGEEDRHVGARHVEWWQAHIPHATLTYRPGADHGSAYLLHWEDMLSTLTSER